MPTPARTISPETLAMARQLYEQSDVPVADIARMCGFSEFAFHRRIRDWGWPRRSARDELEGPAPPPALDDAVTAPAVAGRVQPGAARPGTGRKRRGAGHGELVALIEANCKQYLEIFSIMVDKLGSGPEAIAAAERAARALAVLARTVRDLKAAEGAPARAGRHVRAPVSRAQETSHATDGAAASDVVRLREGLSKRLAELRGRAT